MVPIYDAANSTDAHLVKNLLEQAGIASYIRGEYLQGGLGDLPVSGMVQVCVDAADSVQAKAILDDWRNAVPSPDDEGTENIPARAGTSAPSKAGFGALLFSALLGGALGAGAMWLGQRGSASENGIDYNDDGRTDERVFYLGENTARIETDRNFDGKTDLINHYAPDGTATRLEYDNDFDGRMEGTVRYLHNQWQSEESDENGDGAADYRADAISGVTYSQQWLDAEGRLVKRVQFRGGIPVHADVDTNADGELDIRRHYDRTGEIVRNENL